MVHWRQSSAQRSIVLPPTRRRLSNQNPLAKQDKIDNTRQIHIFTIGPAEHGQPASLQIRLDIVITEIEPHPCRVAQIVQGRSR